MSSGGNRRALGPGRQDRTDIVPREIRGLLRLGGQLQVASGNVKRLGRRGMRVHDARAVSLAPHVHLPGSPVRTNGCSTKPLRVRLGNFLESARLWARSVRGSFGAMIDPPRASGRRLLV